MNGLRRTSDLVFSPHLHPGGLLPPADGVVLEGELVLPDDGPAVLVPHVRHHVHVWSPHLKLPLPVDDGGERGAHQERPLGVALVEEREIEIELLPLFEEYIHGIYMSKTVTLLD